MSQVNLEKRIKRHVKAAEQRIAVICHPELEDLAREELRTLGFEVTREDPGVLVFSGRISDIYVLHAACRIPSSIRIRLGAFRCGSREDLFRHIRGIPWEYWIRPETRFALRLSVRSSRIQHEGRAGRSAWKAVAGRLREFFGESVSTEDSAAPAAIVGRDAAPVQKILVQVNGTRASVSLDATGDLLYKRGWGRRQGRAPLRENIAAAMLAACPFPIEGPLVDAMSGSGTLLGEGILSRYGLDPLPRRDFVFQQWPVFSPGAWQHEIRQRKDENCRRLAAAALHETHHAVEIDPDIARLLGENIRSFADQYACDSPGGLELSPGVRLAIHNEDFFAWAYQIIPEALGGQSADSTQAAGSGGGPGTPGTPGTLLFNPPYDWRIDGGRNLYSRIWSLLSRLLPAWRAMVLVPLGNDGQEALSPDDRMPGDLSHRAESRDFPHGGRRVRVWYIDAAVK
jgi:putative N6-adenine-specific DNA methylase